MNTFYGEASLDDHDQVAIYKKALKIAIQRSVLAQGSTSTLEGLNCQCK
jgi:hypothetical protein